MPPLLSLSSCVLLSEPARLCKVHLEFLHLCSDYPRLSRPNYTWTKKNVPKNKLRTRGRMHIHPPPFHNSLLCVSTPAFPFLTPSPILIHSYNHTLSTVPPISSLIFCSCSDSDSTDRKESIAIGCRDKSSCNILSRKKMAITCFSACAHTVQWILNPFRPLHIV